MKNSITSFTKSSAYKRIINDKLKCYFISPHLDDAVFSSANLLSLLIKKGISVSVVNIFTEANHKPYTLSVYKFLWQCGYSDATKLFQDRRVEDRQVIVTKLGAQIENLGFIDALWRRRHVTGIRYLLSKFIGECDYVYPMYRLGLAQGIVSTYDNVLYTEISKQLSTKIAHDCVIFCPLAIGRHVDHLIVRDACMTTFKSDNIIYWSDYPYEIEKPLEVDFIKANKLSEYLLSSSTTEKNELINGYKSQLNVIFGGVRDHSKVIEKYYVKSL